MPHSSLSAAVPRPAGRAPRTPWQALWRWGWRIALALLSAGWVLALAAWGTVHAWILPRLDDWRPRVESLATQALGHPVAIGRLTALGPGWLPAFTLDDVVLRDAAGRVALQLPRVQAALSVPSLLALRLRFDQLLIEGARLDVRRDASGQWFVGGLPVGTAGPALQDDTTLDWLFQQHELLIRGGTLRWVDEQRDAPALELADVQLLLRNRGRRHELRLDATPPPAWGDRFTVQGQARGALLSRAGDWRRWQGTLHAHLPRADVAHLRRHVDWPVDLQQGRAALRAWADWDHGLARTVTLDAALRDVQVRLGPDLAPVAVASLQARFVAERQAHGVQLSVKDLGFTTAAGAVWAPSQLSLRWRPPAAPGAPDETPVAGLPAGLPGPGGEFTADRLDLPLLAALGEHLPLGTGLRELLRQLQPEGTVQSLQAGWDGPLDRPNGWRARAEVKGLAIAAAESPGSGGIGRPGWRGADLQIQATHTGGEARLGLNQGALALPGVFESALVPLDQFSARLLWQVRPAAAPGGLPAIELKVQEASFRNADAQGTLQATWRTGTGAGFGKGARLPGVLLLEGRLAEGRAERVARYLPLGIGAATRHWVQHAVRGGRVEGVDFRVQGDLWDFPFVNKRDGDFRISGRVQGVDLAPVPSVPPGGPEPVWDSPWPGFSEVSGELVFERNSLHFSGTRGTLWGLALDEVKGRIRTLGDAPVLEVEGRVRGPAADLLRVMRIAPLADASGRVLDAATATGAAELALGLNIPLGRTADSVVKAGLLLAGNDVRLRPDLPLLAAARGRLEATHRGVQLQGVQAQLMGGAVQIDGGTQADGGQRFTLAGQVSADALRRATELGPVLPRVAQRLQGQAAYRLQLAVAGARVEWQLASNLQGMAIDLPAPLGKPADQVQALRLAGMPEPVTTAEAPREGLRLSLGPLQGHLLLAHGPAGTQVLRSSWAHGAPLPEPLPGGQAVLALDRLDLDAWRRPAAMAASGGGPAAAAGPPAAPAADDGAWWPHRVLLSTPALQFGGRQLTGVQVDLQRLAAGRATEPGEATPGWRVQLQSEQARGTLDYREPRQPGNPGRVRARLARLALPAEAESALFPASGAGAAEPVAADMPALDIEVADFELRGRPLGRLAVQAVNRVLPGGRLEWQLTQLRLANDEATLEADGRWRAGVGAVRPHMALEFTLNVKDGGRLLERLGFGRVLRGAQGKLEGDLAWQGSPLGFDLPTLGGRIEMAMTGGQFLQVDPGAARLLGVLSLQALPRRLLLDFRDVFQQGFAFDNATADLSVRQGVAHTDNLRLRGLQALVAMAGSADIGEETQDLHVVVVPELNTGSATLAYAAVNPAVGLGAFVGQWLLREPLRQASAREFRVTGRWDEPKVARVERGLLDPLPAGAGADAPGGAAPPPARP